MSATFSPRPHRRWTAKKASSSQQHLHLLVILLAAAIIVPTAPLSIIAHASTTPTSAITKATTSSSSTALQSTRSSNGEYGASLTSRLLYKYADPLLQLASKRHLEPSDAFSVPKDKLLSTTVPQLETIYTKCREQATKKEKASNILAKAILKSQKQTLILTGVLRLLNTIVQAFPSLLIARLLRQIEAGNSIRAIEPLRSAFVLVSVLSVKMIIENLYFHNVVKCASEVRGSVGGMIFDKSLKLSSGSVSLDNSGSSSKGEKEKKTKKGSSSAMGSGEVVNLMQSDATTLEMLTLQLHTIWDGALQISIYTALLYKYLGTSVIWGLAVLLTTIPINSLTLRILNRLSKKELEAKDARMKKTTEGVSNMQLLKLMSWENIFAKDIQRQRDEELKRHTKRGGSESVISGYFIFCTNSFTCCDIIGVCQDW